MKRFSLGSVWCGAAFLLWSPSAGWSQSAPPPPPAFRFLRWQEDWSQTQPAVAGVKHIDLGDGAWLSLGGDARARVESWRNFNFGAPVGASHDDTFVLTRWRTHADWHAANHGLRFFVEGKGAYASDRDLPGGIRSIDEDKFELQQAFVEFDLPGFADLTDSPLRVRVGRQLLAFGAQRLVSGLPWANALRTWDGGRIDTTIGGWKVTALGTVFVPTTSRGLGESDSRNQLQGLYLTRPAAEGGGGVDYYLLRTDTPPRAFNGSTGRDARWTLGTRQWGPLATHGDYELELSYQVGSTGAHDVTAWSFASQIGYSLPGETSLRLWAGFDWASGDSQAGGRVGTFNQLFPLGHAYFGITDVIGRQNIIDLSAGASWKPTPALTLNTAWHHFRADETADAIYNPGGGVVRPGGSYTAASIGDEFDLTGRWSFSRHWVFEAGFGHFFAGKAIAQSGPAGDIDFVYVSTTATF